IGAQGVAESVRATHQRLTELLRHEHASLALAQRCSGVAAPTPLFSALLNYRHTQVVEGEAAHTWDGMEGLGGEERTNYPLTVSIDDLGQSFVLTAQVDQSIGAQRLCDYLHTALERLITALEQTPQRASEAIDILPPQERQQLLLDWNSTERPYPQDVC